MKILTAAQFKDWDAYTIQHEPIESIQLMERAAQALTKAIRTRWSNRYTVKLFAGPGNNGGDALAIGRLLSQQGYRVEAYLFNTGGKLSKDCQTNKERLLACEEVTFTEVTAQFDPPSLTADDLVIDGLFGTGLNKPLNGGFASLVKYINSGAAQVVSIDMPSGLMGEDNTYNLRNHIVRADVTLTIQHPKLAFLLADNAPYAGQVVPIDIGLSPEYLRQTKTEYHIQEPGELASLLRPRNPYGHKGTFGHALLVAGSYGMAGAAMLAARACLRSGVGKLTVHTPLTNGNILQQAVPEAVLSYDGHEKFFTTAIDTTPYQAIAIGPGLNQFRDTEVAFIEQVRHAQAPLIIDADGLNILSSHKGWLQQIPANSILTPHPGEFSRIVGNRMDDYSALYQARTMAIRQHLYLILKGHRTAICTPEGITYFNPTGNSGMATAGSGDVLTGILLGLLASGYTPEEACRLGVYLHGLAGDLAAEEYGEESLVASDIVAHLPQAFKKLKTLHNPTA